MFGLIASLEGYYGAESYDPRRVMCFLIALIPCIAAALTLGVLAITGNGLLLDCDSSAQVAVVQGNTTVNDQKSALDNFNQCSTSYKLYGFVELLGGAALGVIIWVVVASSFSSLKMEAAMQEDKQVEIETSTLNNSFHL